MDYTTLDQRLANTIRGLTLDAVQGAESGHPGLPLGMADAAVVLWTRFLKHNPQDSHWPDRDRFILSAGHGSMLIYSLLHLTGYGLSREDLKQFRHWGSKTPGHPEIHLTPGLEVTTGPLGQGIATSVGVALAEQHLAATFNQPEFPLVDHYTYVICSDGDLMEGVSHEAASLAGHLKLGKLIWLYDDNHISIDGPTELTLSDDAAGRFAAYGWQVLHADGQNMGEVSAALEAARADRQRPSLIITRTVIGWGMPNRQGTSKAHSDAPGADEIRLAKERLCLPADQQFFVADDVLAYARQALDRGHQAQSSWNTLFDRYSANYPELAERWQTMWSTDLPKGWDHKIPFFEADAKGLATRAASGKVIDAIIADLPQLIGGSADLTPSNNTRPKNAVDLEPEQPTGRYIHFGVREHGMIAALNGLALHGGLLPYGGTFFTFSDYCRPAIRLAALMEVQVLLIFTHDSVGLGEDGPTHQPVEHLAAMRAMPHLSVIRPADANETSEAWRMAVNRKNGPTALILSRQPVPTIDRKRFASADGVQQGGYILLDTANPDVILIATGSEVHLATEGAALLADLGVAVRIVSLPSWDVFEAQSQSYRDRVLPPHIHARVGIEAAVRLGWDRYIGAGGRFVGVTGGYGASAPYKEIYKHYGLTPERVASEALELLGRPNPYESSEKATTPPLPEQPAAAGHS
ncbi:MAG: transketolase [Herpetosiphon sp.]